MNKGIQEMDRVVQQNASSAEEMATTAEELSGQAERLQTIMGFFKLHAAAPTAEGAPVALPARKPSQRDAVAARAAITARLRPEQGRSVKLNFDVCAPATLADEFVGY